MGVNGEQAKFYRVDGVRAGTARRILKFYFQDAFKKMVQNNEDRTFDVYLHKPATDEDMGFLKEDIQYFVDSWGKRYTFTWANNEEEK